MQQVERNGEHHGDSQAAPAAADEVPGASCPGHLFLLEVKKRPPGQPARRPRSVGQSSEGTENEANPPQRSAEAEEPAAFSLLPQPALFPGSYWHQQLKLYLSCVLAS